MAKERKKLIVRVEYEGEDAPDIRALTLVDPDGGDDWERVGPRQSSPNLKVVAYHFELREKP
jgi:hypothetical protein